MITIHSGGEEGADMLFGNIGTELGYKVVHHSFAGHAVRGNGERKEHNAFQLLLADTYLLRANQALHRSFPPRSAFVKHLLQRNLYQVKDSEHIVAIARIERDMRSVKGETGWVTRMGIDLKKDVFVFDDGQTNCWHTFNKSLQQFIPIKSIPDLSGDFAGIGTREITSAGAMAIREVLTANIPKDQPLRLWTAQYRYNGPDRFDITVKGGANMAFAPTWEMVRKYKSGGLSEAQYTAMYIAAMNESICNYKEAWDTLLSMDEATLVCFCPAGTFCHRHILAQILERLGARYLGERVAK